MCYLNIRGQLIPFLVNEILEHLLHLEQQVIEVPSNQ
uniref:Uncharacterized protein n=1 Tax=Anguilla anguilla TaxID=7936 RepID=A0A0E9UMU6_ANGAN